MCSNITSSKYKSTLSALQLFLSKVTEGGCIAKASLQYTLLPEVANLACFKESLTALTEDLNIPSNDITNRNIPSNDITNRNIPSNDITNRNIPSNDITNRNIPSNDITNRNILSNDITDRNILSNDITNRNIPSNDITNRNIPSNDITNRNIPSNDITDRNILSNVITNRNTPSNDITNRNSPTSTGSSICFSTLLETPAVVLESTADQSKTSKRNCDLSCGTDPAMMIERNSMNITENLVQTPTTTDSLCCGGPSLCVYSSNQLVVINNTEKNLHTVVNDQACKNHANHSHMEVSLSKTDCSSSVVTAANCLTNMGLVNCSQCPVRGEQHSVGTSGMSYNNVSSLPVPSLTNSESQIVKHKDGLYNNHVISPHLQLTDTSSSSEYIEGNSIPVVLNSSSYSLNFEAPHPSKPICNSPTNGQEIASNNLFSGAATVLCQTMIEPEKKFVADDLSDEPLETLPFLCCKICTNVFLLPEAFSGHICKSLELTEEKSNAQNLIRNKNKLDELKKFTCGICGIELRSVHRMTYHLPRCQPGPYCCELCTAQFQQRPSLNLHIKTQHRCMSCHACEECGKKFKRRTSLQKHVILRHEDASSAGPYRCDECPKKFVRRIYLTNHKLRMHHLPKPFTCEVCGRALLTKASLAVHHRCVHGPASQKLACSHCPKLFSRKEKLVLHLRRHTGERPFVCEVCSRGFVSKSKLQEHKMRQHLPQHARRRHPCSLCHKTYANRTDLSKHTSRVHAGSGADAYSRSCSADQSLHTTSRGDTLADTEQ
ncbi:Zinc finger C2H2-type [Trinorchestia longiramus]|nr:Zinc finger C2H2-type [Trinorchestia longiramus]